MEEISYYKLREKMIKQGLKWKQLQAHTGISQNIIAKINKNELISSAALLKICAYFDCQVSDIMTIIKNEQKK